MRVFKFGGASVKDAKAVLNLVSIIKQYHGPLVVVVSAMGKTTNALENVVGAYFNGDDTLVGYVENVLLYHTTVIDDIFPKDHKVRVLVSALFEDMERKLTKKPSLNYNFEYDQIVSFGELLSTTIVCEALKLNEVKASWWDIRESLKTDNNYREARVDWELTTRLIEEHVQFTDETNVWVTQGFLGSTINNITTTLGREGSDYSGAIIASILNTSELTIWKDVPGVLNADPKFFKDTVKLDYLSYQDAIELAYYGTSVIHPKTVQPLKRKNMKLVVKSFYHPQEKGTIIENGHNNATIPSFIFKHDQVLIHILPFDFSFIAEDNLKIIFGVFAQNRVKMNLMQNSAISFMVCTNNDETRIPQLISDLKNEFDITYETGLELITIRHYNDDTIKKVAGGREILLEQKSRNTIQMVVR